MIPIANIRQWRQYAPWLLDSQVEQDLALSRALIEIYSDPLLSHDNVKLTKALFEENISLKLADSSFIQGTTPLLPEDNNIFDPTRDFSQFSRNYITHLPGDSWKGRI